MFTLKDISSIDTAYDRTMDVFTPDQLRVAINGLSSSPCVVLYESHFTVIEPHLSTVDLDNILLEFETGVLSILNQAGTIWRTDTDLAREVALSLPQEASHHSPSPETEPMDIDTPRCQRNPLAAWEESKASDHPGDYQCPIGTLPIAVHSGDQSDSVGETEVSWGPREQLPSSKSLNSDVRITRRDIRTRSNPPSQRLKPPHLIEATGEPLVSSPEARGQKHNRVDSKGTCISISNVHALAIGQA
jgi:hypothetical protein